MRKIILILFFCATRILAQNTYVVTSNTDPLNPFSTVAGELRWAIEQANAHTGPDNIVFNIPTTPAIINLQSQLPSIIDAVNIDGMSQPNLGYLGNRKKVVIAGDNFYSLFDLSGATASNSSIKGIEFKGKNSYEVTISYADNISVLNNVIYSNDAPNSYSWLLYFFHSNNNTIRGNILGTDESLTTSSNFNCPGVRLAYCSNNIIGGGLSGEPNLFYNMNYPFYQNISWVPLDVQLGNGNKISQNLFVNNVKNIDIYTNAGCLPMSSQAANLCKQPPIISSATKTGLSTIIMGTSLPNDFVEIFKSNNGGVDAVQFLGTAIADANGNFTLQTNNLSSGDKINSTATDQQNNTSEFSLAYIITEVLPCTTGQITFREGNCVSSLVELTISDCFNPSAIYNWNFGDGTFATGLQFNHSYSTAGNYTIIVTIVQAGQPDIIINRIISIKACTNVECKDCIGSFQPEPGDYILSAWVREEDTSNPLILPKTYSNPKIAVSFNGFVNIPVQYGADGTKNKIIEGWQRIEEIITIPSTATDINLQLLNISSSNDINVYFDDIRIYPKDGQMKTYVYDPITLRLTATLDENNYATFYEYDEEGKLIRVKKETEKGIMTVQESREATKKK